MEAARSAANRAQEAEDQLILLQSQFARRDVNSSGASSGESSGGDTLAEQIADRLTSIAPRLHNLLQESGSNATARRNVALHNAAPEDGRSFSAMTACEVKRLNRGLRHKQP